MIKWLCPLLLMYFALEADAAMTCPMGAICKYVRPANDGNGTDLNYGTEDGLTEDSAFDGLANITGLVAGDTVCFPGSDEPFFETFNTTTPGVTYAGCGTTKALIWFAQGLSGNRSFSGDLAAINTSLYAWESMGNAIFKKRIDVIARMLWEDNIWLTPTVHYTDSEATILSALQPGTWTYKDAGDTTGFIYYRATTTDHNPVNTVIRTFYVPGSLGTPTAGVIVDVPNSTFQNIEFRGYTRSAVAACPILISDTSGTQLIDTSFDRNETGPCISSVAVPVTDTLWLRNSVTNSSGTGAYISPGVGLHRFRISGGDYSGSTGLAYGGSAFASGDADGIGIGQLGGAASNISIEGITCSNNRNSCVFIGTTNSMTVTNLLIQGAVMSDNTNGCINESASSQISGLFVIAGVLCRNTMGGDIHADINFSSTPPTRTIVLAGITFTGSRSYARIDYKPDVDNKLVAYDIVFTSNPGSSGTRDGGDWYFHESTLIGDEIIKNQYFFSTPYQHKKIGQIGSSNHRYYDGGVDDLAGFNTATQSTGTYLNVDPQLTTNFRLKPTSPLKSAGMNNSFCRDARGRVCPPNHSDIGAYQSTSGDPAAPRAVRN